MISTTLVHIVQAVGALVLLAAFVVWIFLPND